MSNFFNMKKILIFYIAPFSGHHKAALFIQKEYNRLYPTANIHVVNALRAISPLAEKWMLFLYMTLILHFPNLWSFIYNNDQVKKKLSGWRNLIQKHQFKNLLKVIRNFSPDKIICTQAYPCQLIARYRKYLNFKFELIGVITDYVVHSYWYHSRIDQYFVPNEEAVKRLLELGTKPQKISISGIPVHPDFSPNLRLENIKNTIDKKIKILIMGGGYGLIPIEMILEGLYLLRIPYQAVLIIGTNKINYKKSLRLKKTYSLPLEIYEYIENIGDYMDQADFLISKPGGLTSAEAIIKGLPMLICSHLPGQEKLNAEYLVKKGVAFKVYNASDLAEKIHLLIKNPSLINQMRLKINSMRHSSSVSHIIHSIEKQPSNDPEKNSTELEIYQ